VQSGAGMGDVGVFNHRVNEIKLTNTLPQTYTVTGVELVGSAGFEGVFSLLETNVGAVLAPDQRVWVAKVHFRGNRRVPKNAIVALKVSTDVVPVYVRLYVEKTLLGIRYFEASTSRGNKLTRKRLNMRAVNAHLHNTDQLPAGIDANSSTFVFPRQVAAVDMGIVPVGRSKCNHMSFINTAVHPITLYVPKIDTAHAQVFSIHVSRSTVGQPPAQPAAPLSDIPQKALLNGTSPCAGLDIPPNSVCADAVLDAVTAAERRASTYTPKPGSYASALTVDQGSTVVLDLCVDLNRYSSKSEVAALDSTEVIFHTSLRAFDIALVVKFDPLQGEVSTRACVCECVCCQKVCLSCMVRVSRVCVCTGYGHGGSAAGVQRSAGRQDAVGGSVS
jgi:hypothetical protein